MAARKAIPVPLRNVIWNTYIGRDLGRGQCYCCVSVEIFRDAWECGHVVALAKGGQTNMRNLRPVCGGCNKAMGSKNMIDFATENGFQDRWPADRGDDLLANATNDATPTKPSGPAVKPGVKPGGPATKPGGPATKPGGPAAKPGDSAAKPEGPAVKPGAKPNAPTANKDSRGDKKAGNRDDQGDGKAGIDYPAEPTEGEPGSPEGRRKAGDPVEARVAALGLDDPIVFDVDGNQLMTFLATTETYEHNRQVDQTKVNRMVAYCRKEYAGSDVFDFRSTMIAVAICPGKNGPTRVLLDGGHRKTAIALLDDLSKVRALLWVKRCRSREQIEREFYKINCGTPVPAAYYSEKTSAEINRFINMVDQEFPGCAREGKTAKRPYFLRQAILDAMSATTELRDAIIDGDIDAVMIFAAMESLNRAKGETFLALSAEKRKSMNPGVNIEKVEETGFYLGVSDGPSWARAVALAALNELAEARRLPDDGKEA